MPSQVQIGVGSLQVFLKRSGWNVLALEKDSEIVQVFQHLGDKSFNLNTHLNLLEEFTCTVYAKQSKYRRLTMGAV